MGTPDVLLIRYEKEEWGRFTELGRYGDGNQFFVDVTGAYPVDWWISDRTKELSPGQWDEYKRWYAVLHRFDAEGNHLDTEVFSGGNSVHRKESCQRAWLKSEEMLASIGPYHHGDIQVKLFSVKIDGYLFGLVYGTTEDFDVPDEEPDEQIEEFVMLQPNGIMFHPPWDSGDYST